MGWRDGAVVMLLGFFAYVSKAAFRHPSWHEWPNVQQRKWMQEKLQYSAKQKRNGNSSHSAMHKIF